MQERDQEPETSKKKDSGRVTLSGQELIILIVFT